MLSKENIETLCRVGQGTVMGDLMRQYWLPCVYSWELTPDGDPLRVRMLGEDLIAWRATNGTPGFIANNCPHRGASLFFGRNEEQGLRCVNHGWKFDTTGQCVDVPNEPAESDLFQTNDVVDNQQRMEKTKVKAIAYRGADAGGITWIYMGPRQAEPPGLPQWEWCQVPENQLQHSHKAIYECNYMQALEGELDTTHVYFLHSRLDPQAAPGYGLYAPDRRARLEIVDTNYGVMYAARRNEEDGDTYYWRTTQFLFPVYGMFPGGGEDGTVPLSMYVPIDDEHTLHWGLWWHPSEPMARFGKPIQQKLNDTGALIGGVGPMKPHQTGKWFADWWPEACIQNDFLMNRDVKKTKNFTGIPSVRLQDDSVITSMGPIMDRTKEHLGTADATIIRVRRRMIEAAKALRERGVTPPGVNHPELYTVRSCQAILPKDRSWQELLDDWHSCRTTDHPTGGFKPIRSAPEGGFGRLRNYGSNA